jgi:hypothetical protein
MYGYSFLRPQSDQDQFSPESLNYPKFLQSERLFPSYSPGIFLILLSVYSILAFDAQATLPFPSFPPRYTISNPAAYPIPVAQEQSRLQPMVQTKAPTATNYPPIGAINATHVTNIGCYIVPK